MLFNTKKDRVIHHGTYAPTTSTIPENVEEEATPKVLTPCAPIPPSIASANPEVDAKLPDSSNGNDDIVGPTLQPEQVESPEKSIPPHIDISSESLETKAVDKNVTEVTDVAESIQVDEISSTEIPEESTDSENKGVDEVIAVVKPADFEDEKQSMNERNETEAKHENVQTLNQSNAQKSEQFNKLKELLAETGLTNATPQTAFSDANENVQPTTLEDKLHRSGAVVPVEGNCRDDSEARNDVVLTNGPRHKQPQQHSLFPAATPDVRSIKRRHSLNSQNRNTYADVAPLDPKTYVSIKSRYKVPIAKSSVAGNATSEENNTLKNTSNRQTSGAAGVGNKRRHSAIAQAVDGGCALQQQEPCAKRRTRSEDRPSLTDENNPANQVTEDFSSRLSWPTSDTALSRNNGATATLSSQDRLSSNTFQRRSLGKKATLVKTIRRPSISGSNRLQQLRGSFGLRDWDQARSNRTANCNDRRLNRTVALMGSTDTTMPQRWLRLVLYGYLLSETGYWKIAD